MARGGSAGGNRLVIDTPRITLPQPADVAKVLAEAARIQRGDQLRDETWRAGWRACALHLGDAYERGFADGAMSLKRAQHDAHRLLRQDVARWGPGGRHHFADPRPGDYMGNGAA